MSRMAARHRHPLLKKDIQKMAAQITLYEISEQVRDLLNRIADTVDQETGEITDPAAYSLAVDQLSALELDFSRKVEAVACFIQEQKALASAMKETKKRIEARQKSVERRIEWLAGYLQTQMEKTGTKSVESPQVRVSLAKAPQKVEIYDKDQIPENWRVHPDWVPDKAGIKASIKAGIEVPGARLSESGVSVRIK